MRLRYVLLLAGLPILFATPVRAQSFIHVPSDMGLQPAIEAVLDGGIIEIAAGTYAVPAGNGFAIADKAKQFTIRAASGATVILDGAASGFIFSFINSSLGAGRPVTFEGLTFDRGISTTDGRAGGITLQRAQGTFLNCKFTNNNGNATNVGGGAVLVGVGSTAFFSGCLWQNNRATAAGSAIEIGSFSRVFVHDSEFLTNRTNFPNHSHVAAGGAIHMGDSVLDVTNSRFIGNESGYVGGAIYAIGTWADPVTTPAAEVTIADCYFQDNKAKRDPSVTDAFPTEGGAFHAENQTTAKIYNSRFVNNQADTGGAVNLYRADVEVRTCVFKGNTTLGGSTAFGGTFNAISADGNEAINRRSAKLTLVDSLVQGRVAGQTIIPNDAGCLFVAGDGNRQYGLAGVTQMGGVAENRAVADITRTVFFDCDSQGVGGAIEAALASVTLTDSIVMSSNAALGAGVALLNQSAGTVTNSTLAKNAATQLGGGIFVQGSTLNMSGSRLVANAATQGGSAIYSVPDDARGLKVSGLVQTTTISESTGPYAIYDSDRLVAALINDLQYNANIISNSVAGIYVNDQVGLPAKTVSQLNALVVNRGTGVPSTIKSPGVDNTVPALIPNVAQILAVPPNVLAAGAHNEIGPFPSYLGYAWGGPPSATLNGASRSGNIGLEAATTTGAQTLVAGTSSSSASVGNAASPSASLVANPPAIIFGGSSFLSWNTPTGTFADGGIDQGIGRVLSLNGTATVSPSNSTTYRYVAVTQEGGAEGSATVNVGTTALGTPAVTLPTNGSTLTTSTQMLVWTAVSGAQTYEVLLTDFAAGNKAELHITVPDLSTIYSLHSSSRYDLKVRACQAVCGAWSPTVSFAVSLPAVPTGAPGITGCTVSGGNSLTCSWNAVARADLYRFYVVQPPPAGPGGGALTVAARVVSATTATLPVPKGAADVIVAACNGDGCGPFSPSVGINPAGPNPAAPSLGTPLGGSIVAGPTVMFSWNRVPGDNGSNTLYRLFVGDLSRTATALDVYTTQNFWSAVFMAEGSRYDGLVIANPGLPSQVQGPAQGFNVSGVSASAPTMVSPAHQSSVKAGSMQVAWTPVPGAGLYQYRLAAQVGAAVTGVTPGLFAQVTLGTVGGAATLYIGIARACPSGLTCTAASDTGWGPWSNAPGGPGITSFTVVP